MPLRKSISKVAGKSKRSPPVAKRKKGPARVSKDNRVEREVENVIEVVGEENSDDENNNSEHKSSSDNESSKNDSDYSEENLAMDVDSEDENERPKRATKKRIAAGNKMKRGSPDESTDENSERQTRRTSILQRNRLSSDGTAENNNIKIKWIDQISPLMSTLLTSHSTDSILVALNKWAPDFDSQSDCLSRWIDIFNVLLECAGWSSGLATDASRMSESDKGGIKSLVNDAYETYQFGKQDIIWSVDNRSPVEAASILEIKNVLSSADGCVLSEYEDLIQSGLLNCLKNQKIKIKEFKNKPDESELHLSVKEAPNMPKKLLKKTETTFKYFRNNFKFFWSVLPTIPSPESMVLNLLSPLKRFLIFTSRVQHHWLRLAATIALSAFTEGLLKWLRDMDSRQHKRRITLDAETRAKNKSVVKNISREIESAESLTAKCIAAVTELMFHSAVTFQNDVSELIRFEGVVGWEHFFFSSVHSHILGSDIWTGTLQDVSVFVRVKTMQLLIKIIDSIISNSDIQISNSTSSAETIFSNVKKLLSKKSSAENIPASDSLLQFCQSTALICSKHLRDKDVRVQLLAAVCLSRLSIFDQNRKMNQIENITNRNSADEEEADGDSLIQSDTFDNIVNGLFVCEDPAVVSSLGLSIDSSVFENSVIDYSSAKFRLSSSFYLPKVSRSEKSTSEQSLLLVNYSSSLPSSSSVADAVDCADLTSEELRKAVLSMRSMVEFAAEFGAGKFADMNSLVLAFWNKYPNWSSLGIWASYFTWCVDGASGSLYDLSSLSADSLMSQDDENDEINNNHFRREELAAWMDDDHKGVYLMVMICIFQIFKYNFHTEVKIENEEIKDQKNNIYLEMENWKFQNEPKRYFMSNVQKLTNLMPKILDNSKTSEISGQNSIQLFSEIVLLFIGIDSFVLSDIESNTNTSLCFDQNILNSFSDSLQITSSQFINQTKSRPVIEAAFRSVVLLDRWSSCKLNDDMMNNKKRSDHLVIESKIIQFRKPLFNAIQEFWSECFENLDSDFRRVNSVDQNEVESTKSTVLFSIVSFLRHAPESVLDDENTLSLVDEAIDGDTFPLLEFSDMRSELMRISNESLGSQINDLKTFDDNFIMKLKTAVAKLDIGFLCYCHHIHKINTVLDTVDVSNCQNLESKLSTLLQLTRVMKESRQIVREISDAIISKLLNFYHSSFSQNNSSIYRTTISTLLGASYAAAVLMSTASLDNCDPGLIKLNHLCNVPLMNSNETCLSSQLKIKSLLPDASDIDEWNEVLNLFNFVSSIFSSSIQKNESDFEYNKSIRSLSIRMPLPSLLLDSWAGTLLSGQPSMGSPADIIKDIDMAKLSEDPNSLYFYSVTDCSHFCLSWLTACLIATPCGSLWNSSVPVTVCSFVTSTHAAVKDIGLEFVRRWCLLYRSNLELKSIHRNLLTEKFSITANDIHIFKIIFSMLREISSEKYKTPWVKSLVSTISNLMTWGTEPYSVTILGVMLTQAVSVAAKGSPESTEDLLTRQVEDNDENNNEDEINKFQLSWLKIFWQFCVSPLLPRDKLMITEEEFKWFSAVMSRLFTKLHQSNCSSQLLKSVQSKIVSFMKLHLKVEKSIPLDSSSLDESLDN